MSEVIDPIYAEMLEIHTQYLRIFNTLSEQLISIVARFSLDERSDNNLDRKEVRDATAEIRQQFIGSADEFNGQRTKLRAELSSYLRRFKENSFERAFIWATAEYFLRNEAPNRTEEKMVYYSDRVAEFGAQKYYNTPSANVIHFLSREPNLAKILRLIGDERSELNARFSDVSVQYSRMKND